MNDFIAGGHHVLPTGSANASGPASGSVSAPPCSKRCVACAANHGPLNHRSGRTVLLIEHSRCPGLMRRDWQPCGAYRIDLAHVVPLAHRRRGPWSKVETRHKTCAVATRMWQTQVSHEWCGYLCSALCFCMENHYGNVESDAQLAQKKWPLTNNSTCTAPYGYMYVVMQV
jgi:hypothetical protein